MTPSAARRCGANSEILQSFTGIGPKVSASLIAVVPELGTLPGTKASALAGLAPMNRDSGQSRQT